METEVPPAFRRAFAAEDAPPAVPLPADFFCLWLGPWMFGLTVAVLWWRAYSRRSG